MPIVTSFGSRPTNCRSNSRCTGGVPAGSPLRVQKGPVLLFSYRARYPGVAVRQRISPGSACHGAMQSRVASDEDSSPHVDYEHSARHLRQLRASGWCPTVASRRFTAVFCAWSRRARSYFQGIIGYDETGRGDSGDCHRPDRSHDMLSIGEKGQAKSRLMRVLVGFWTSEFPTSMSPSFRSMKIPIDPSPRLASGWWPSGRTRIFRFPLRGGARREDRYAERSRCLSRPRSELA